MTALERHHDHDRALELAAMAIDFDLTNAESAELDDQMAACPQCSRAAAAMRSDAGAMRVPLTLVPSRRVDDAIYAAIAGRRAGPQRVLLLAATALLLLGLLAALAVGASLLANDPLPVTVVPTNQVALLTPAPDPSLPPPPAPAPAESWQTLPLSVGPNGGRLIEAVASYARDVPLAERTEGSGLVGVGRGGCYPVGAQEFTDCFGAAWTSGEDWSLSDVADHHGLDVGLAFSTSGPEKGLYDVASGPNGLVAIGYPYDDAGFGVPGIWRSADGRVWERVAVTFAPAELGVRVSAVTASERGYVVVGWVVSNVPVEGGAITARAAAWVSGDGTTWTRADDSPDMDVGPCVDTLEEPGCGGMLGVSPNGEGFVAVGYARTSASGDDPIRAAAWTSPNGVTWTRSDTGRLDFDGLLSSVAEGPSGPVAVGTICQPDCFGPDTGGVAATSADGSTWAYTTVPGSVAIKSVASSGHELFAVGMQQGNGPSALQVWRSPDGVAWDRLADPPAIADLSSYRTVDIAATQQRLIVVGWAETNDAEGMRNFAYATSIAAPPGEEPVPTPTATPPPSVPVASAIDAVVELRVEIRPDVSVGRMPLVTVYGDGTVLQRDDTGGHITRLSTTGLERLLSPALDSDVMVTSGELGSDPTYQGGVTMYTIDLRRGSEIVRRETSNSMAPATRAEAEQIIALAERLADLEAWLPADAWEIGPAAAQPYVASNYLLKVTTYEGTDDPRPIKDRAEIAWPLPGELEDFGTLVEDQPLGEGTTSRCGPLTLAEADAVKRALAGAPFVSTGDRGQAHLQWADLGHLVVTLVPLLPDDAIDCTVDDSWP